MLVRLLALVLVLASGACRCGKEAEPVAARATEPPDSTAEGGLPFIRDDYDRALALARERKLPLFVDAWAPWCHSCLSMERTVFPDPRLRPMADRFVWLSLNTEKEESVAFLQKFPQTVWPTFTILDPESERPLARSLGSLTVDELLGLLGDALRAAAAEAPRPDALLAEADRLHAEGEFEKAVAKFEEALSEAGEDWPSRPRAVLGLLAAQRFGVGDFEACEKTALREISKLARSASWAKVADLGLRCAVERAGPRATAARTMKAFVREAIDAKEIEMSADDRSDLYDTLVYGLHLLGDHEKAKETTREWLEFLEQEAARTNDASVRAIFDSHRLFAARQLNMPERVLDALLASEHADPDDYNPPARLAEVYLRLGRLDEALAACNRALEKVYGPRKARVLNLQGEIFRARGEYQKARMAHEAALIVNGRLPEVQQSGREVFRAQKGLLELEKLR